MPENYICKDCNYTSDASGNCPYCDMPLEPLDPTKLDQTTGKPDSYDAKEIDEVEEAVADDPDYIAPVKDQEDDVDEDNIEEEPEEVLDEAENNEEGPINANKIL